MSLDTRRASRVPLSAREQISRFFDEPFSPIFPTVEAFLNPAIPLDMAEDGDMLRVTASLPGVDAENIHVEIEGDRLRIRGEVTHTKEAKDDSYYLQERRYGRVERAISLPFPVKTDGATAEFDNGVLELRLPRSHDGRQNEVKVQAKSKP